MIIMKYDDCYDHNGYGNDYDYDDDDIVGWWWW